MKQKTFVVLIAGLLWQSLAFSQSNPLFRYIPDDVTMVISIDAKSIGGKIPAETFRESFIYREMMKDPNMPFATFLAEPEKLGIDLSAGILVAMKEEYIEGLDRNQTEFYLFIKLRDAEVFTAQMKKMGKDEESKIEVYGTDRIMISDGPMAAAWNNNVFVLSTAPANMMRRSMMPDFSYVDSIPPDPAKMEQAEYEWRKTRRELCFALLAPKTPNAFALNKYFIEGMGQPSDIRMWSSGGTNPFMQRIAPVAGLMEKLQSFSGKNKVALINFENGKIVIESRNFPEGVLADIYKKSAPGSQNTDLVKRLPAGTLIGLANISINQQMADELMQKSGLLPLMDSIKKDIPFDLSLLPGVFRSTMMIALVKSDVTDDMDTWTRKAGGLQWIFALPIADKVKFEKLKAAMPSLLDTLKGVKEKLNDPPLFAKHTDDLLVISFSPQTADAFLQSKGDGEVPAWLREYNRHPMVVSIGLKELFTGMQGNKPPEEARKSPMTSMLGQFDRLLIYGGSYENESINSRMEFRFSNQDQNALKLLFDMVTTMAEKNKLASEEYGSDSIVISVDTTVVMDTAGIVSGRPPIPAFKDPELQQFAKDYDEFISEYVAYIKNAKTDSAQLAVFAKRSEEWPVQLERLYNKISSDPEELNKFTEWLVAASRQMGEVMQELTLTDIKQEEERVPPPPPPPAKPIKKKVEKKKTSPQPVIKN